MLRTFLDAARQVKRGGRLTALGGVVRPCLQNYSVGPMSDEEKRDPKALARSVLAKTGAARSSTATGPMREKAPEATPAPAPEPETRADESTFTDHPEHEAVAELIDLYFTLDDPLERDACFEQIAESSAPVVVEFMRAVLQGDEDEYVRASAAAELARRGDPEGRAALLDDLADPENIDFFTNALQTLAEVEGQGFYDRLYALWSEDEHDAELMLEVLATMESLSPNRALNDFVRAIDAITEPDHFRDDQFEAMVLAFVRAEYTDALANLRALRERAARFSLDPADHRELLEFIDEGIALLQGSEAPG